MDVLKECFVDGRVADYLAIGNLKDMLSISGVIALCGKRELAHSIVALILLPIFVTDGQCIVRAELIVDARTEHRPGSGVRKRLRERNLFERRIEREGIYDAITIDVPVLKIH